MFQLLKIDRGVLSALCDMFDELDEPVQVLTGESPRPLVVHRTMGQLTLVRAGRGYASLGGETLPIEAGDLLVMAPGCEHSFRCPSGELELRHWHWPQALLNTDRTILADTLDFGAVAPLGDIDPR